MRRRIHEILRHLGEWLLIKTVHDIEQRYFEIGERRASQGVALSDFCWAIGMTKEQFPGVPHNAKGGCQCRRMSISYC